MPEACERWAAATGADRCWALDPVDPAALRAAGVPAVVARGREHARVLLVQETTAIAVRAAAVQTMLGPRRAAGQRGLLLHSVLAGRPGGAPLGLLHQAVWTRDPAQTGRAATRRQRPMTAKASGRWLTALAASQAAVPEAVASGAIADRAADSDERFAAPRRADADLRVRAAQERCGAEAGRCLWATGAHPPPAGTLDGARRRRDEPPPRPARLPVRFASVTWLPPRNPPNRAALAPIPLRAVIAEDLTPPEGAEPVCWRLLTTLPVPDPAAVEIVRRRPLRWLIERSHFVLKSGCSVQALHLETRERLERALAADAVVAWRLLGLTYLARQDPAAPCDTVLAPTISRPSTAPTSAPRSRRPVRPPGTTRCAGSPTSAASWAVATMASRASWSSGAGGAASKPSLPRGSSATNPRHRHLDLPLWVRSSPATGRVFGRRDRVAARGRRFARACPCR